MYGLSRRLAQRQGATARKISPAAELPLQHRPTHLVRRRLTGALKAEESVEHEIDENPGACRGGVEGPRRGCAGLPETTGRQWRFLGLSVGSRVRGAGCRIIRDRGR